MVNTTTEGNYNKERIKNIYENEPKILELREKLHERFAKLIFVEDTHKYTVEGKEDQLELTSVTTWIGRFGKKFDSAISEIKAKVINSKSPLGKRKSSQYYRKRWANMRVAAEQSGTRVHEFAEFGYPYFADDPYCDKEKGIIEFYNTLDPKYVLLESELRIYSEDHKLAGTIDCLGLNLETGKLVIFDWKTNTVPLSRKYKTNSLSKPFEHLGDTSFNKYCLQLSLYKTILEKEFDCEVEELWLIHLTDGNLVKSSSRSYEYETLTPDSEGQYYVKYNGEDVSKELKQILNDEYEQQQ